MPWGAIAGAAVSVAGNYLTQDKKGGAGSSSSESQPWANAIPWLVQNLNQGYGLQQQYTANPFSQRQLAAYDNLYGLSDAVRAGIPSLLQQGSQQQLGYDKNNPSARPKAYDLSAFLQALQSRPVGSSLSATPPAVETPKAVTPFTQQNPDLYMGGYVPFVNEDASLLNGGLGAFRYGDQPAAGTQAYRDMNEYFQYGGNDPLNRYNRTPASAWSLLNNAP